MGVKLGKRYRDKITGLEGVAIARTDFVYGCTRVSLQWLNKEGKPEEYAFDEPQLEEVKAPPVVKEAPEPKRGGWRAPVSRA